MKFQIEKFKREYDESSLYYRENWDDLGIDDVLIDDVTRTVMVGCKDSGLHMFFHDMISLKITYHYIEIEGKDYKLRLSYPIIRMKSSNDNSNSNDNGGGGTIRSSPHTSNYGS